MGDQFNVPLLVVWGGGETAAAENLAVGLFTEKLFGARYCFSLEILVIDITGRRVL